MATKQTFIIMIYYDGQSISKKLVASIRYSQLHFLKLYFDLVEQLYKTDRDKKGVTRIEVNVDASRDALWSSLHYYHKVK